MRMRILTLGLLLLTPVILAARPFTVVVYNVENLHDADGVAVYDDYQPAVYTPAHALTKVRNIASVIANFPEGQRPDIILFQEIEVDHTPGKTAPDYPALLKRYADTTITQMLGPDFSPEIADLPAEALLLKAFADRGLTGYTVVTGGDGEESARDPAERPAIKTVVFTRFPVKAVRRYPTQHARNILEVQLDVDGHPLTVFDNHWKSGAGDAATELVRIQNAGVLRKRLDELLKADPNADIIIGGDLNSHYNQKRRYRKMPETAINDILGSQGNELAIRGSSRDLYNLWFELPPDQRGSDTFSGEWGTLMNLIVTRGLYDLRGVQYIDNSFGVAKFPGLNADAAGLPVRWSSEGAGGHGFSDHFPIYARFRTVDDNQPGKFMPLVRDSGKDDDSGPATSKVDLSKTDFASAVVLADLPAGTQLRDGTWTGKLFRVDAKALDDRLLRVEFNGETYDVYGPRKEIRDRLYAQRRTKAGQLAFYGELGTYKGSWQFLVKSEEWVK
ncbi:MAG: endonuclease/exonuclease/phosphatase family protein [Opitutaceae bacterium]